MQMQPWVVEMIVVIISLLLGLGAGMLIKAVFERQRRKDALDILSKARKDAEGILKEAKVAAKEESLQAKEEFEKNTRERRSELQRFEEKLDTKEIALDRRGESLEKRAADLEKREQSLRSEQERSRETQKRLDELVQRQTEELERVAGLTREEAKASLLGTLEAALEKEKAALIRRSHDEAGQERTGQVGGQRAPRDAAAE